jgi:hypothetical protein
VAVAQCDGRSLAQVTLLCAIATTAGGEYVEKIAQLRLHNDTTSKCFAGTSLRHRWLTPAGSLRADPLVAVAAGYVLSATSTPWCEGACQNDLVGLTVMEVNQIERRIPFAPRTAAFLSLPFPNHLHDEVEPADPEVVAAFWGDVREISTLLRDCGADAVMIYHGQELCHEPGQLFGQGTAGRTCIENSPGCGSVHLLGHCKKSMEEVRQHPVIVACRMQSRGKNYTYPATVELPLRSARAVANAVSVEQSPSQSHDPARRLNLTVDFHVTLSACGNYGQFPAMYLSLVPLWTGLAFVWIALSCQVHSSFATTIHSVMTVVPVLKVLDVVISAWLWTDCVASGKFSTAAVLAWVAIRSLYEPFFMLVFLLIANGWCILRRDMPRSTSITISVVITSLYLVLALNFLYAGQPASLSLILLHCSVAQTNAAELRAGNFWWLVGTITVGTIVYSVIRVRGFVVYLTEKIDSMDPQAFQEMYSQVNNLDFAFYSALWHGLVSAFKSV